MFTSLRYAPVTELSCYSIDFANDGSFRDSRCDFSGIMAMWNCPTGCEILFDNPIIANATCGDIGIWPADSPYENMGTEEMLQEHVSFIKCSRKHVM